MKNKKETKQVNGSRATVYIDDDDAVFIDDWRSAQRPIPSQAEAVRHFLKIGLKAEEQRHA